MGCPGGCPGTQRLRQNQFKPRGQMGRAHPPHVTAGGSGDGSLKGSPLNSSRITSSSPRMYFVARIYHLNVDLRKNTQPEAVTLSTQGLTEDLGQERRRGLRDRPGQVPAGSTRWVRGHCWSQRRQLKLTTRCFSVWGRCMHPGPFKSFRRLTSKGPRGRLSPVPPEFLPRPAGSDCGGRGPRPCRAGC